MEVIWKAVLGVLNFWIRVVVDFHNKRHGFMKFRLMGTASLKVNPIQQLTEIIEEVL